MYALLVRRIINVFLNFGYWGFALAAFFEGATVPFPGILLLLFGGALSAEGVIDPYLLALLAAIAYTLGSILPYLLGRYLGDQLKKWSHIFRVDPKRIDLVQELFNRYGQILVMLLRPISFANLISYFAGLSKMNFFKFLLLTSAGISLWSAIVVIVGRKVGTAWKLLLPRLEEFIPEIIAGVIIVIIIAVALNRLADKLLKHLVNNE